MHKLTYVIFSLLFSMCSETAAKRSNQFDQVAVKMVILAALSSMYGLVGAAAYPVDLLNYDTSNGVSLLRIAADAVVPVRAALTLHSIHDNKVCKFDVLQVSPFLAALACPQYV
jgi:RNase P/RNase MRP subunit POP5